MLEAWRRGLKVEVAANRHYTISSPEKSHSFRLSRLTSPEASRGASICNSKHETKQCLLEHELPTPEGSHFSAPISKQSVLDAATEIGFPVCLKATNWSKGKGVYPGITGISQLEVFLDILVEDLGCDSLLLEKHFEGQDFRFFVVGDKVSGVIKRVPANVEGDGTSTVEELIAEKNRQRSRNPYLKGALIEVDEEVMYLLGRQGYELDSIPPLSQVVFLREKSNASAGGDSIDVTDKVSEMSKKLAIDAIKAIPGLNHGGVDVLLKEPFTPQETGSVLEINQSAEMGLHLYPAYGESRYPPADILDFYFPNSQAPPDSEYWYFDLDSVFRVIRAGVAESVVIKPRPKVSGAVWQEIIFGGTVQGVGLRKWIKQQALRLSMHGEVRNEPNGQVQLRICASASKVHEFMAMIERGDSPGRVDTIDRKQISPFRLTPGVRILKSDESTVRKRRYGQLRNKTRELIRFISTRLRID